MSRYAGPLVAALAAVALLGLLGYGLVARGESTTLDEAVRAGARPAAPSRELPVLGDRGSTMSLADMRGKVVVLNFWASWCEPCKDEAPVLERAHRRLTEAGESGVLGVTYQDSSDASLAFARENGLTYPSVRDVGVKLAEDFGTRRLPETFVVDRDGRIVAMGRGEIDQAFMDRALREALGS